VDRSVGDIRVELVKPLIFFRSWVLLASALFALVSFSIRVFSPAEYSTSVVLVATSENDGDRLSQLSGFASLAGISIKANTGVSNFERFTYLLHSPELAEWQIKRRNILQLLFPEKWDPNQKSWRAPSGIGAEFKQALAWVTGDIFWHPPDAFSVVDEYDRHLEVRRIASGASMAEESGLVRLTYSDTDPTRATEVLGALVADANEMLRADAAARAAIQSEYLREKLKDVSVQEYRETLQKLLSEQEQTLMLTSSRLPFAAQPVSGQSVPPKETPRRTLLFTLIGAALGFSLSYFIAILAYNWNTDRLQDYESGRAPQAPVVSNLRKSARSLWRAVRGGA
jgi:hypothetical protein